MGKKILPIDQMTIEDVKELRLQTALASVEALRRMWRLTGCVGCPREVAIKAQVLNRMSGKIPSYCCKFEGQKLSEDDDANSKNT